MHWLFLARKNKRIVGTLIAILLFLFGITGFFVWQKFIQERAVVPQEEQEKLEGIEKQIGETQKRLEELSKLSPEEIKKREGERRILSAKEATEDISVEGVEIVFLDNVKRILNKKEGYRIDVPPNLFMARTISSDWIEFHDRQTMCQDPSCDPALRIRSEARNPNKFSVEQWLALEEKNIGKPIYSPREKLTIGGETVFRVREEIPPIFDGFYYYWARGENIYSIRISIFDEETYRFAIESFTFENL